MSRLTAIQWYVQHRQEEHLPGGMGVTSSFFDLNKIGWRRAIHLGPDENR
jgi:hypothetical protein